MILSPSINKTGHWKPYRFNQNNQGLPLPPTGIHLHPSEHWEWHRGGRDQVSQAGRCRCEELKRPAAITPTRFRNGTSVPVLDQRGVPADVPAAAQEALDAENLRPRVGRAEPSPAWKLHTPELLHEVIS